MKESLGCLIGFYYLTVGICLKKKRKQKSAQIQSLNFKLNEMEPHQITRRGKGLYKIGEAVALLLYMGSIELGRHIFL